MGYLSRVEHYYAYLIGEAPDYPVHPQSRVEKYLKYLCEHGGGGDPADINALREEVQRLQESVDNLELFKFPNTTIIGNAITINHGQVSGFTANSYMKFPFLVDFRSKPFAIDMAFTTSNEVVAQQNIFDSKFGMAFAIINKRFVLAISTNGTSWNLGAITGTYEVKPNTTYYVRIAWTGSVYSLSYSLDKETYIQDATVQSSMQPFPKEIVIGVGDVDSTHPEPFSGTINLNNAYLTVNGTVVWSGMDDVGIASRLATDLSNLDQNGEAVIQRYINDAIGPIDEALNNLVTTYREVLA